jgi:hypothetical protein
MAWLIRSRAIWIGSAAQRAACGCIQSAERLLLNGMGRSQLQQLPAATFWVEQT